MRHIRASTPEESTTWHALTVEDALAGLETSAIGLSAEEAAARRELFGRNELPERKGPGAISLIVRQFRNPLIYVLLLAGVVAVAIGEVIDAAFIFGVLLVNAAVGAFQEWQAEHGAQALQSAVKVRATVRRGNVLEEVDAAELVPGDIVQLQSGDAVPADLRIISEIEARVDESVLTGESEPVEKDPAAISDASASLGDRFNMLYAGTSLMNGRATAVVAQTGHSTQLGQIARSLTGAAALPPLVSRMRSFTARLTLIMILFIAALAAAELVRGTGVSQVFLLATALAVAAIPEGLPVGVTVALSIASRRMARRNVIVRLLPAVEGLGACTVIATDKTGTLTVNRMTVKRVILPTGVQADVSGDGLEIKGELSGTEQDLTPADLAIFRQLARVGVLCNEAQLHFADDEVVAVGDTVDAAFLVLGEKLGIRKVEAEDTAPRVALIPYESARSYAASYNTRDGAAVCSVKGAADVVLAMCQDADRDAVLAQEEELASDGYRVIALATGTAANIEPGAIPKQPRRLRFLGLVGLIDPVRPEVPAAVQRCRNAGVVVKMVTGDHPVTGLAIARQIGIASNPSEVVAGRELSDSERDGDLIQTSSVFARVEPGQKTQIVTSLQESGHYVAVTGDGVNDAPALRAANIGVAMGKDGSDVARDASDLIIADDNFASIVNGIEEGRTAYDNVRKIIWLLLTTGLGELLLFLMSTITGQPIPLTPIQLLWLNMVTNGIQDVALAFESKEPGVLRRPPRPPGEQLLDRRMIEQILLGGSVMGVGAFVVYYWALNVGGLSAFAASNMLLLVLVLFENVHVFNVRSETRSVFKVPFSANPWVVGSVVLAQVIHIGAMYTPGLRTVLDVEPVNNNAWLAMLGISLSLLVSAELYKRLRPATRRSRQVTPPAAA